MIKHLALACALIVALAACDSISGDRVQEVEHRTLSARGVTMVRIINISGSIDVRPAKGDAIVIDSTRKGATGDDVARTHVDISTDGGVVRIETKYDKSGGFLWFNHNGGSVDYRVQVPAGMTMRIDNVSGPIAISNMSGDVSADDVSGSITATLGRMSGNRRVSLHAISGGVSAGIARKSDVHITASAISGGITQFADGDVHDTRLGSGSASLNLSTISGPISVVPL